MRKDGINPVLGTRMLSYPNISAYEILAASDSSCSILGNNLNKWSSEVADLAEQYKPYHPELAALVSFYEVSREITYRQKMCDELMEEQRSSFENLPNAVQNHSMQFGRKTAELVLKWADKDRYKQTKGMNYYVVADSLSAWRPTPPGYREAMAPHWYKLRPFVIDSPSSFTKPAPVAFDTSKGSAFYQLAKEVYDTTRTLTKEQQNIAKFWDDNPNLNRFKGHVPMPRRHINPAGHWMNIISQVVERNDSIHLMKASQLYTFSSIAFFDANICSWYDKYHYNLLRPVTYIRRYIDPNWEPLLVTPAFPEHTSAHSACTFAVTTVLTDMLSNNYSFCDSTHYDMGFGVRCFNSFHDAANEVAISRFYGGIHYMTAATAGKQQGIEVGNVILISL